jgi:lysophospholipase L1-like esterase
VLGRFALVTMLAVVACRESEAGVSPVPASPTVAPEPAPPAVETPMVAHESTSTLRARVKAQRSALGSELGLFEDERGKPVPWLATPSAGEPGLPDDVLDGLPGSSGLGDPTALGERPNGNMLGLFVAVEGPGDPLAHFHRALRRLEGGFDDDGKVRVLLFGASHTEADIYPQYLRSYLQERFGNGGHGFTMPALPWRGYQPIEVEVRGFDHWETAHAQHHDRDSYGRYGLLGARISTRSAQAFGQIVPAAGVIASRYELYYLAQPRGGTIELFADGRAVAEIPTHAAAIRAGYHAFELPPGEHTIELRARGDGQIDIYGITLERDEPGVVVDTLGISGTRAANALEWDAGLWREHVQRRRPDLVVLAFGTNEATDAQQPIADYEERLRAVLARYRDAIGDASCVLVGPGDFPQRDGGDRFVPRPRVREIIAAQRRAAPDYGCGFWDLQGFMGGELAMTQWVRAEPPMANPDHVHLTRRGYVRMGMALADALLDGFDRDDPLRVRAN